MAKQIKIKDESKAPKKINTTKLKKSSYKLVSGTALTVAAFASFYNLFADHLTNTPDAVAKIGAAVVTVTLVLVIAQCDTK